MRADLLTRQAALLRRDAANPTGVKFDLSSWAEPAVDSELRNKASTYRSFWKGDVEVVPVSCSTKACAFGLAAISGEFKAEGLTYHINYRGDLIPRIITLDGIIHSGFTAAEVLFGIEGDDAEYLFDPDCYEETPVGASGEIEVAQRIEHFIVGNIDRSFHPRYRGEGEGDDD